MGLFIKKNGALVQIAVSNQVAKVEDAPTVALDMASGDQVVEPSGQVQVFTQVTIKKPDTMIPGNIKKDVNIGGVVGSYEAVDYLQANIDGQTNIDYINDTSTSIKEKAISYFSCFRSITLNAVTSFVNSQNGGGDYVQGCHNATTISFNALKTWNAYTDGRVISYCNGVTQCNFPNLETVTSTGSTSYSLLSSLASLTEVTFPKLKTASARIIDGFQYLANIYFPSLETISVPSNNSYGYIINMQTFRTNVKVFLPKIQNILSNANNTPTMQFGRYSGSNYTLELHIGEVGSTTQIAFGSHAFRGIPSNYSSIYIYGDVMPTLASNSFHPTVTGINVYVTNASVKTAMENDTNWADAVSSGKITISLFTPS